MTYTSEYTVLILLFIKTENALNKLAVEEKRASLIPHNRQNSTINTKNKERQLTYHVSLRRMARGETIGNRKTEELLQSS